MWHRNTHTQGTTLHPTEKAIKRVRGVAHCVGGVLLAIWRRLRGTSWCDVDCLGAVRWCRVVQCCVMCRRVVLETCRCKIICDFNNWIRAERSKCSKSDIRCLKNVIQSKQEMSTLRQSEPAADKTRAQREIQEEKADGNWKKRRSGKEERRNFWVFLTETNSWRCQVSQLISSCDLIRGDERVEKGGDAHSLGASPLRGQCSYITYPFPRVYFGRPLSLMAKKVSRFPLCASAYVSCLPCGVPLWFTLPAPKGCADSVVPTLRMEVCVLSWSRDFCHQKIVPDFTLDSLRQHLKKNDSWIICVSCTFEFTFVTCSWCARDLSNHQVVGTDKSYITFQFDINQINVLSIFVQQPGEFRLPSIRSFTQNLMLDKSPRTHGQENHIECIRQNALNVRKNCVWKMCVVKKWC